MTASSAVASPCVYSAQIIASQLSSRRINSRLRMLAAIAAMLMLLLALSPQAFSQTCSTSCTGLCLQQTTCSGSATTSITGTVYAPNGTTPLPNVLVYVPNAPLASFPPGVACGVTASGCPLVSAVTATNGTFTLTNMPVGTNIPLVIQAGKWRTQTTISDVPACVNTPVSLSTGTHTNLPQVHTGSSVSSCKNGNGVTVACTKGDIPQIAVVTGSVDAAECVLMKLGVDNSEFTNPPGYSAPNNGRINFYSGDAEGGGGGGQIINSSTPTEAALFATQASVNAYDLLMFPCQGSATDPVAESATNQGYLATYANAGGHVYATHYSYEWIYNSGQFPNTVDWAVGQTTPTPDPQTGYVNTGYPAGAQLAQWLQDVGASTTLGQISLNTLRKDQNGVLGSTQSVLTIHYPSAANPTVMQLTFNTPLSAQPANQCGQVLFNEYHVFEENNDNGEVFPAACSTGAITPQEQLLAYSLVGLSTVVSAEPAPMVTVVLSNSPASFVQGDSADTITINVTNTSTTSPTNATLTLTVAPLPAGLTVASMVGSTPTSGWTCNTGTLECTRTTGLSASTSDAITLTVSVAANAPSSETVSATAAGGNLTANVTGTDTIPVLQSQTITFPTIPTQTYGGGPVTLNATASSNLPVTYSLISGPAMLSGNMLTLTGAGNVTVQASQAGNSQYGAATPVSQTFAVNQETPSVNVTVVNPSSEDYGAGTPVNVTATFAWTGATGPSQPLTFSSTTGDPFGAASCSSAGTLMTCHATFTPAAADPAATYNITATYAGDTNFTTATSPQSANFTISPATTTTAVTSSQNPSVFGQSVTFTATVTGEFGMIAQRKGKRKPLDPTGMVTWSGAPGCTTSSLTGNPGVATCTTSSLAVGTEAITANYNPDPNHQASAGSLPQQVSQDSTTTSVTGCTPNPSSYGQSLTCTVTVSANAPGAGTPTGNITWTGLSGCTTSTLTAGSASCTTITEPAGANPISANYSGDTNDAASASAGYLQTVNVATTTTAVTSGTDPSVYGQSVTFTATVTGQNGLISQHKGKKKPQDPGGMVTWSGAPGCNTSSLTGNPGVATCTTTQLPTGSSQPVTATYGGDVDHLGSNGSVNQTVNQDSTTTTIAGCTPFPSTYGQSITCTVTVAANAPGAGTPTGSITWTNLFGCTTSPLSAGSASCTTSTEPAGQNSLIATYTGDGNFTASTSPIYNQLVSPASTTTAVSSGTNPSVWGQSVTFTANITGQYGLISQHKGKNKPQIVNGSVAWSANTGCGTTPVTPGYPGVATCTTTGLAVGNDVITATYVPDPNHQTSTGTLSGGQQVNQASTAAVVGSSLDPSTYGQPVSFTAAVAPAAPGAGSPTGSVQFAIDGTNFGSPVTLSGGSATSGNTSTLTEGTHSVTATYSGDSNFQGATAALSGGQVVQQATATTTVSSSQSPSVFGQSVTFTATISGQHGLIAQHKGKKGPQDVSGTVAWSANTGCGTTPVTTGNPGTATCTTSNLPVGTALITAAYSGDSNHGASSGTLNQQVNQASTAAVVSSSADSSTYGQAVSFTAAVAPVSPGAGSPTGTVQFVVDGSNFGAAVPLSGGSATSASISTLTEGTHSVTATYSGDGNFLGATATLSGGQIVGAASTTTTVTSSLSPSTYNQSVTFTATISGQNGLISQRRRGRPQDVSGTVTWSANTGCGTTPVQSGNPGTATCTTSTLPGGTDPVTALYNGDSNHSGSSGSFNQVVNPASQTITFPAIPNQSGPGTVTLTATASSGLTVTYNIVSGPASVVGNIVTTTGSGTVIVQANQSGDGNYNAAPPVQQSFTVGGGSLCNGIYTGIYKGNLTVTKGEICIFSGGGVTGNLTQSGGEVIMENNAFVDGNYQMSGGSVSITNSSVGNDLQINGPGKALQIGATPPSFNIGPGASVGGNLQIQALSPGSAADSVCGTTIKGNLTLQSSGNPVQMGSGNGCAGNTTGGDFTVQSNTAATTIDGNTVGGNLIDQNNTAATQVFTNHITNNLQCQGNTSITGGGNTVVKGTKQGQCSTF